MSMIFTDSWRTTGEEVAAEIAAAPSDSCRPPASLEALQLEG